MRELSTSVRAQMLDLRGAVASQPALYAPDDYRASEAFAREPRWPYAEPRGVRPISASCGQGARPPCRPKVTTLSTSGTCQDSSAS